NGAHPAEACRQEGAGEGVPGSRRVHQTPRRGPQVGAHAVLEVVGALGVELQGDSSARVELAQAPAYEFRFGLAGERLALLGVREDEVETQVGGEGHERLQASLTDELERPRVEGQGGARLLGDLCRTPGGRARWIPEERPRREVQVAGPTQQ